MGIQNAISSGYIPTYATSSALPALARDGQLAVVLDTDTIYIFDAGGSTWVASAGGSPGQDNFSYKRIAESNTVTIPDGQQMIVVSGSIEIAGTLSINGDGELFLLEAF